MMRIQKSLDTRCSHHHKKPVALVSKVWLSSRAFGRFDGFPFYERLSRIHELPFAAQN